MTRMFLLIFLPLYTFNPQHYNIKQTPLTNAQIWAIAASNVQMEAKQLSFDSLAGTKITDITINKTKNMLKKSWDINDRESFLQSLKNLQGGGHSIEFETYKKYLSSNEQSKARLKSEFNDPDFTYKYAIVKKYSNSLGSKSLYGWDASRYICLCRYGYVCGYISEEEAWEKIMPMAKFIQKTFDSWRELGRNYLIGREFWYPGKEDSYFFKEAYLRLLEMPDSPWVKLKWNLPLDEEN
ncbi:MAG: DUF1266 domain-containing protein [Planctomycetaceae bacterium]|nr:DUF1266 domain-containing protein [Planctomycetaceae bacterium]